MINKANLCFRFNADWTDESVGQLWNIWETSPLWLKMKILSLYRVTSCRPVAPVLVCFFFWPRCAASWVLVSWPGTKLAQWKRGILTTGLLRKSLVCLFVLKICFWKLLSGIIWQWCTTLTTWVNIAALPWLGLRQIQLALHIRGSHVSRFNQLRTKSILKTSGKLQKAKVEFAMPRQQFL